MIYRALLCVLAAVLSTLGATASTASTAGAAELVDPVPATEAAPTVASDPPSTSTSRADGEIGEIAAVDATPTVPPDPSARPSATSVPTAPAPALQAAASSPLVGVFRLTPGSCGSGITGTYFRMIQPGGVVDGPDSAYLVNADSTCSNKTYTPLQPGVDGGLTTGAYQAEPNPAFDGDGNSLANRITLPASFFGVKFSTATSATDPQSCTSVPAPTLSTDGSNLTGDLRTFGAAWNNQHFNQGAPKPDGSAPGLTGGPTGTYNPTTNAFTLTWTSQIVGGPFNNFTGQWHFAGTFSPAASGPAGSGSPGTDGNPSGSTTSGSGAGAASSSLANTGAGTTALFWIATALVLAGAGCLASVRRRRGPAPLERG